MVTMHYCRTSDDSTVRDPADTTEMAIRQKQILAQPQLWELPVHIVHSVTSACHWSSGTRSGNWPHIALPWSRNTYQQKNETNHGAKISNRTLVRRHELKLEDGELGNALCCKPLTCAMCTPLFHLQRRRLRHAGMSDKIKFYCGRQNHQYVL